LTLSALAEAPTAVVQAPHPSMISHPGRRDWLANANQPDV